MKINGEIIGAVFFVIIIGALIASVFIY